MSKVLILTRFVKEYEPRRLAKEARNAGFDADLVKYGQIDLGVVNNVPLIDLGHDRKLADYDYIIPRAASKKGSSMVAVKAAILAAVEAGKVLNGESFAKYPLLGKIEQGLMLAREGLSTVPFFTFGSKLGWKQFKNKPAFNFPLIVKGRFGSHGRTVKLVNDWQQFDLAFKQYHAGQVLVQPQIKIKQWYRVVIVGGKYLGEMRHRQKPKYGAVEGKLVKFNSSKMKRLEEICLKAVALVKADYAGLDVAWDEDKQNWIILEINRTAQFKYFERKTKVNVAKEIINYLL